MQTDGFGIRNNHPCHHTSSDDHAQGGVPSARSSAPGSYHFQNGFICRLPWRTTLSRSPDLCVPDRFSHKFTSSPTIEILVVAFGDGFCHDAPWPLRQGNEYLKESAIPARRPLPHPFGPLSHLFSQRAGNPPTGRHDWSHQATLAQVEMHKKWIPVVVLVPVSQGRTE